MWPFRRTVGRMSFDVIERRLRARSELPEPRVRRALREAAGVSQADVAAAVGVSRQAVDHWESGTRYPRPKHLAAYLEVLRILRGGPRAAS